MCYVGIFNLSKNQNRKNRVSDKNKNVIDTFNSIKECIAIFKNQHDAHLDPSCIGRAYKYNNGSYKGFYFEYV